MDVSDLEALIAQARAVRENAYAAYSGFKVGTALQLDDGRVFLGVNVENCSYPLSVCSERHAVAAAVAAGALPGQVTTVAIVAESNGVTTPCGACRQVLAEFGRSTTQVVMHNLRDDSRETMTLDELLPKAFTQANFRDS